MVRLRAKIVIFIAPAILLTACNTTAQREAASIGAGLNTTKQKAKACGDEVAARPEFAPLAKKMKLDGPATLQQLADQERPTAQEARLLGSYNEAILPCRQLRIEGMSKSMPQIVPILMRHYADIDAVQVDLMQRKLSWGEGLQRLRTLGVKLSEETQVVASGVQANLQQRHDVEIAEMHRQDKERQEASQNLIQIGTTLMQQNSRQPAVTTTCNQFGTTTTCTSQ